MNQIKQTIRKEYKIAMSCLVVLLVIGVLSLIFVLLPIYSLVGESADTIARPSSKLGITKVILSVAVVVTYLLTATIAVSLSIGIYKDVRKKP